MALQNYWEIFGNCIWKEFERISHGSLGVENSRNSFMDSRRNIYRVHGCNVGRQCGSYMQPSDLEILTPSIFSPFALVEIQ